MHAAAALMRLGAQDPAACKEILAARGIENLALLLHAQEGAVRCDYMLPIITCSSTSALL